jgi:hypothetical protein
MTYEMANAPPNPPVHYLIQRNYSDEPLLQRQNEWADKAVRRYTLAQRKKWHRWQEAMFEKVV